VDREQGRSVLQLATSIRQTVLTITSSGTKAPLSDMPIDLATMTSPPHFWCMVQTAPIRKTDDEAQLRAAVKQAATSLDAGRSVPYEDVRRWMLSWGTDKELPAPK